MLRRRRVAIYFARSTCASTSTLVASTAAAAASGLSTDSHNHHCSSSYESRVRDAYRRVLRAVAVTFAGDAVMLKACRAEAHKRFNCTPHPGDNLERQRELLAEANEAARFLVQNVAQASSNDSGKTFVLHVDPMRHEINDNMDVKKLYVPGKRVPCTGPLADARFRVEPPLPLSCNGTSDGEK